MIVIEAWSLDELVRRGRPSGRLSFVKIDVEGAEIRVLEGALQTLQRDGPVILCEFNESALARAGSPWPALLGRFEDVGYGPVAAYKEGRFLRRLMDRGGVQNALIAGGGVVDVMLIRRPVGTAIAPVSPSPSS